MSEKFHLGLDVGSGTCKLAVLSPQGTVHHSDYRSSKGRPLQVAHELLHGVEQEFGKDGIRTVSCTGTGGKRISSILDVPFVNEVICHTKAVEFHHPEAKTIIDIGGEDAKLIIVDSNADSEFYIRDFALNTVCAAGTGAFLEQQAARMGYSLQEFSEMALKAELIPSIAGRCTVFAKSDMIHLQQNGMPDYEVVAGLCFAIVRNLQTNIAKGKEINPPLVFQGGVAANMGVRRAMRETLVSADHEFVVPENFKIMGAIGASLEGMRKGDKAFYPGKDGLDPYLSLDLQDAERLRPLSPPEQAGCAGKNIFVQNSYQSDSSREQKNRPIKAYLGIDVGSVSTKLALLTDEGEYGSILARDKPKRVLAKTYLSTSANPLEALKAGMQEIYSQLEQEVQVVAVGSTGSGRYLSGDFVGADVVRNEITAQATAAAYINPDVDTIFEIGGQDSKYISLQDGVIKDFAMNKVCAAGTGSFLEEQSVRLGLDVKDFGELALSSRAPVKMGERCTVFMQSDLVHFQQKGALKEDLAAGLCYSIVTNYLNKVVEQRQIGENIVFQGGTAYNEGIVSAFESILDRSIQVPEHNEITGAIGAAILASREQREQTAFKGFDLGNRGYSTRIFECKGCTNRCEIQQIKMEGEDKPFYYGHRCERYERGELQQENRVPDLVRERESALLQWSSYVSDFPTDSNREVIGIPRVLFFQEWLPFFSNLLQELGFEVVISDSTNKDLVAQGSSKMITETCLPIKVANGHVQNLLQKGVQQIFLPQVCSLPGFDQENGFAQVCPYVQGLPWTIRATFDFESWNCRVYTPVFHLGRNQEIKHKEWKEFASSLNVGWGRMKRAISRA
ncbi:MAG: acyl-CoA dehydratase activase, partial [Thermodesulfobacteriota bacterium]